MAAVPPPAPAKEGLAATMEVLKYTLALGTGALVFGGGLVGEKVALSPVAAQFLVASWLLLGLSVAAGALAYARIPVMLAETNYDLEDKFLIWPGRIHHVAFLLGMLALGLALAIAVFAKSATGTDTPAKPIIDKETPRAQTLGPLILLARVGPFVSGDSSQLESAVGGASSARIEDVVDRLRARAAKGELGYLLLVGSADKVELLPALRRRYGSNEGLARLRAESVRQGIEAGLGRPLNAVTLTVGPSIAGAGVSSDLTAADRSVAVYGAWWDASR
jgi:hypothetical protein